MDLSSIINNEAAESSAQSAALATPITPVQTVSGHSFRDYNHTPQSAQSKHPSHDYGQHGRYASPTTHQSGYQSRPSAPPPLQPPHSDPRSPAASGPYSAQSPYQRNTPSATMGSGQDPFPQSPAQQSIYSPQQRENYLSSSQQAPQLLRQTSGSQNSPIAHPSQLVTQGSAVYYQHQRSQSSHSTPVPTPTSAQSQQHYYNQSAQESPLSASPFPTSNLAQHQRQQSQPGTPLGPPISTQRQASGGYANPQSPYQQRPPSSGSSSLPQAYPRASPVPSQPPSNPSLASLASLAASHESHQSSIEDQTRRSHSARERSISVSPKTKPPTLPRTDSMTSAVSQNQSVENGHISNTKRKMDDRDSSEPAAAIRTVNGSHASSSRVSTSSPHLPAKKRRKYEEPPIWAQSFIGRVKNHAPSNPMKRSANGTQKAPQPVSTDRMPKYNGDVPKAAAVMPAHTTPTATPIAPVIRRDFKADGPLGPWEPSILGIQPFDEISKQVADWLFLTVVNRDDAGELHSRGVEVEIEAKLGQLINKETNDRYYAPFVQSECILEDTPRIGFRSSMTEAQHQFLNEYLNAKVAETHPGNPNNAAKPRVPIVYTHRHERDEFYDLPTQDHVGLPASIRSRLNPRHPAKVRVSYDSKTGAMLAKIIKSRVADFNFYNPRFPLDCRISINLEMRYDGDIEDLLVSPDSGRKGHRNKDRLSYKQSHYQIDLTQVTVADPSSRGEKEHELEIELSAGAVRQQGQLALQGQPHQYAELVEGFIDNVRVLSRAVPGLPGA